MATGNARSELNRYKHLLIKNHYRLRVEFRCTEFVDEVRIGRLVGKTTFMEFVRIWRNLSSVETLGAQTLMSWSGVVIADRQAASDMSMALELAIRMFNAVKSGAMREKFWKG